MKKKNKIIYITPKDAVILSCLSQDFKYFKHLMSLMSKSGIKALRKRIDNM